MIKSMNWPGSTGLGASVKPLKFGDFPKAKSEPLQMAGFIQQRDLIITNGLMGEYNSITRFTRS